MATLTFNGSTYTVDHAVKGADYIHGYNAAGVCLVSIEGIKDFSVVTYNGTYLTPEVCFAEACNSVRYVNGKLVKQDGTEVKAAPSTHYHTVSQITDLKTEPFVFTLEDGSIVTKEMYVK